MKITLLTIEKFLGFSEASLCLDNRGLVLIQGVNVDDTSADSNGAGKSCIPDALDWCLFGETARGEKGDAVINTAYGKGTRVTVTIEDEDETYLISRHRKHKTGKNGLTVERITPGITPTDLTKGTDKLTQEVVNGIVGCSHEVFRAAVVAGQEQFPDLPAMTDKQLKGVIEEAAGVTLLEKAYEIARSRAREQQSKVQEWERELERAERAKDSLVAQVEQAQEAQTQWDSDHNKRCADLREEAQGHVTEYNRIGKELAGAGKEKLEAAAAKLREQLDAVKHENERLKELQQEETQAQRLFERAKASYDAKYREVVKARERYDHVEDHVGKPCGECGKLYQTEDLAEAKRRAGHKVREMVAEAKSLKSASDDAFQNAQSASQTRSDYESRMTDVSATSSALRTRESSLEQIERLEADRLREKRYAESKAKKLKEERTKANPYAKKVAELREEIDAAHSRIVNTESALHKAQGELAVLQDAVSVYGPAGVRAHILDTVTPFLNERTAQYLGTLSDGNIQAVWSTISFTAKGEARERFAIDVSTVNGDAKSFKGLSGGQKRKVRLACALALQDLVASRATKPIDLWIGDEVDEALDTAGMERLMTILDDKARERGTVMVISHNDLKDWIREHVTVVREGGVSTIAGSAPASMKVAA